MLRTDIHTYVSGNRNRGAADWSMPAVPSQSGSGKLEASLYGTGN